MTKPIAAIVSSDLHSNSTVAICPPTVNLDDGGTYHASRYQHQLWEWWLHQWGEVGKLKDHEKVLFLNGDLGERDAKNRSTQLITTNKATQFKIAMSVLEPAIDAVDRVYFIRGTEAHVGDGAELEESLAADCTNTVPQDKKRDIYSWYQVRGTLGGVRLDIAHHASMGGLPWTKANGANKLAALAQWYYKVERDQPPPHLLIRSHNHQYADSGGNFPTLAVYSPAWTFKTAYISRIGKENNLSDIGSLMFLIQDGKYTASHFRYELQSERRVWKINL